MPLRLHLLGDQAPAVLNKFSILNLSFTYKIHPTERDHCQGIMLSLGLKDSGREGLAVTSDNSFKDSGSHRPH